MNVLVAIKGINGVTGKIIIDPMAEVALTQAVALKASNADINVHVVAIGNQSKNLLLSALAQGADIAYEIETDLNLDSLTVAKNLACLAKEINCNLIFLGACAIDSKSRQIGPMLAALLDWPQVIDVMKLILDEDLLLAGVENSNEIKLFEVKLPVLVAASSHLIKPLIPTLMDIMKAKSKPIIKRDLKFYSTKLKVKGKSIILKNRNKIRLNSVSELIKVLDDNGVRL